MKKVILSTGLLCGSLSLFSPVKAFFLGSDKFTDEEYAKAGIIAKHYTILLDEYTFKKGGISISQSLAESLTSLHQLAFETEDGSEDSQLNKIYVTVAQHIIELFKSKDKKIKRLSSQVSRLSFENADLRLKLSKKNRTNKNI